MADEVAALSVRLEATAARFERDMQRASRALDRAAGRMERRADSLDRRLERIGSRFGINIDLRAAAAAAAIGAVGKAVGDIVRNGDKLRRLEGRFQAITGSADRASQKINDIFRIGAATGTPIDGVADALTRFTIASEAIGATDEEVARLTENILKLGTIGGSTTAELSAGALQLGQALASGTLQGEELRSILENLPLVARQLADGLGVSVGQLREMGKAGELTADRVFRALLDGADEVDRKFSELPQTVERSANQLANSWALFTAELDESLGVAQKLGAFLETLARGLNRITTAISGGDLSDKIAELAEIQDTLARRASGTGFENFFAGPTGNLEQRQAELLSEIRALSEDQGLVGGASAVAVPVATPAGTTTRRGGGGGGRSARQVTDDSAVRMLESMRERVQLLQEEQQLIGLSEGAAVRLEAQFDREAAVRELLIAAQKEGATITAEEIRQAEENAAAIERLTVELYEQEEAFRLVQEQQRKTEQDLDFFADNASSAIAGLIDGTLKWNDALLVVLSTILEIARQNLLDMNSGGTGGILGSIIGGVVSGIAGGVSGGGSFGTTDAFGIGAPFAKGAAFSGGRVTAFANGGVVSGATLFPMKDGAGLMGEAGPEAIMPLTRGPGGKLGVRAEGASKQITVAMTVVTPDANSFRRSEAQIRASAARAIGAADNRNN